MRIGITRRHLALPPMKNTSGPYFGTGLLVCFDVKGQRGVAQRHGCRVRRIQDPLWYGVSSPRLWKDRLFVACMTKGPSYVVALNAKTGDEILEKPTATSPQPTTVRTVIPARLSGSRPTAISCWWPGLIT